MAQAVNSRNHDIICEGILLKPGTNEITEAQHKKLSESKAFAKHTKRRWAGLVASSPAAAPTNPARPDSSPLAAGTKPEDAPLDYPEANERSKAQQPAAGDRDHDDGPSTGKGKPPPLRR